MIRICFSLAFALAISPTMVSAETNLSHSPSYKEGDETLTEVEMEIDQTLSIAGMDVETAVSNFIVVKETVTDPTPGQVTIKGEMHKMQMDMSLPGGMSLNYDSGSSNNQAPAGPLAPIKDYLDVASEATWTVVYGQDGKVKSASYDIDETKVPEMFQSEMTDERLTTETNIGIDRMPKEPVSKGDTWERNEQAFLGNGQIFYLVREYTYLGREEHNGKPMEKIAAKTKSVTFEIEGDSLPLQLKESDLSVKSSKGTLWYSPEQKQVVESEDDTHFVGTMTFTAQGQELPAELDLTMKVKTNVKR